MAVLKMATISTYVGLSTPDVKPTGVPVGSTFYEYDTGVTYITRDGTNWETYVYAEPGTPVKYIGTMTNLNTEYSQALPATTRGFSIHTRDGTAFRFAYVTGKVATPTDPYESVPQGAEKTVTGIRPLALTLYFACASAGKIVELEAWS